MTSRGTAAVAVAVLAAGSAVLVPFLRGGGGAARRSVSATVEAATVVATAAGGIVREAAARPGDAVRKAQVLARFDAAALIERRTALAAAIESARALATIPRAAALVAVDAHPEVLRAEEEYAAAAAAFEQGQVSRTALDRAAASRMETRRRVSAKLSGSASGIGQTTETLESVLRELDRAIADREARAPVDGVVDVLDLRPGDRVLPGGAVALIRIPGEYTCEFVVPAGATVKQGSAVHIAGQEWTAEGRVERVWQRELPGALREDRATAEETVATAQFRAGAAVKAGSAVRVELP